jgi:hypothetical protein
MTTTRPRACPVAAPRRVWPCLGDAARELQCGRTALRRYLERRGAGWVLRPLDEAMYQRWHRRVWARETAL